MRNTRIALVVAPPGQPGTGPAVTARSGAGFDGTVAVLALVALAVGVFAIDARRR